MRNQLHKYRNLEEFERQEMMRSPWDFEPKRYEETDQEYNDDDEEVQELPF